MEYCRLIVLWPPACEERVFKPGYQSLVLQLQPFLIPCLAGVGLTMGSSPWTHAGNVLEQGMRCFR